jgi:hypothetical protein
VHPYLSAEKIKNRAGGKIIQELQGKTALVYDDVGSRKATFCDDNVIGAWKFP